MEYPNQLFVHPQPPDPAELDPIENDDHVKPQGGMWTSSADDSFGWIEWMERDNWSVHDPDELTVWELDPKDDLDIYVIDSLSDLENLAAEFERDDPHPLASMYPPLDFEAMSEIFDGIRLTENGQHKTRHSQPSLYGWDCECTLHFDWNFVDYLERTDIKLNL